MVGTSKPRPPSQTHRAHASQSGRTNAEENDRVARPGQRESRVRERVSAAALHSLSLSTGRGGMTPSPSDSMHGNVLLRVDAYRAFPAMKCYSVLVGSNNTRGTFARRDATLLEKITARHFPEGFTILAAAGRWYDPTLKSFRKEQARQVILCTTNARRVRKWCIELGQALRQKELILVESGRATRIRPGA